MTSTLKEIARIKKYKREIDQTFATLMRYITSEDARFKSMFLPGICRCGDPYNPSQHLGFQKSNKLEPCRITCGICKHQNEVFLTSVCRNDRGQFKKFSTRMHYFFYPSMLKHVLYSEKFEYLNTVRDLMEIIETLFSYEAIFHHIVYNYGTMNRFIDAIDKWKDPPKYLQTMVKYRKQVIDHFQTTLFTRWKTKKKRKVT